MFDLNSGLDLDRLRALLRAMDDPTLKRWEQSAAYMCLPVANLGAEPRPEFVLQLKEARAEWRRRHPKSV
jgi:hypothetical protein